jgi:hypothetical protein
MTSETKTEDGLLSIELIDIFDERRERLLAEEDKRILRVSYPERRD